jgi:hypothetical protein
MVHESYRINDYNCATTTLIVLSELFNIPLEQQVLYASRGMYGAGGFLAQCGLQKHPFRRAFYNPKSAMRQNS